MKINLELPRIAEEIEEEENKRKWNDTHIIPSSAFQGKIKEIILFLQYHYHLSLEEILNLPMDLLKCYVDFLDNKTPKLDFEFDRLILESLKNRKQLEKIDFWSEYGK